VNNAFTPETGLEAMIHFINDLNVEVGMHVGFLQMCLDVNTMYWNEVKKGPAGISYAHTTGGVSTTPYHHLYTDLLMYFDPVSIGLPVGRHSHYTLGDLALRCLEMLFPDNRAIEGEITTWRSSPSMKIVAEGFVRGKARYPAGLVQDGDGNIRYVLPHPRASTAANPTPVWADAVHTINQESTVMYEVEDPSVLYGAGTGTVGAGVSLTAYGTLGYPSLDGSRIVVPSGSTLAAEYPAFNTSVRPLTPRYAGLRSLDRAAGTPLSVSTADLSTLPVDSFTVTLNPLQLWTMPTPHVVAWLKWATDQLDAQLDASGISLVSGYTASTLQCPMSWASIIDVSNVHSHYSIQFNP